VAAIRLAQLGVDVLLVEKGELGGVCLNVGCIPSKALIHAAHLVHQISHEAADMGIEVGSVKVDLSKTQAWKEKVVGKLTGGVAALCKANGVKVERGHARFTSDRSLDIHGADGTVESVTFRHAVIATGSVPIELPGFPFDEERILSSTGALALRDTPSHLVVIGGGYIGLELGMMWRAMGAEVTIVELADSLLPGFDHEAVRLLSSKVKKAGIRVHLKSRALDVNAEGETLKLRAETPNGETVLEADRLLVTVGRRPSTGGLEVERAGLEIDGRGFLPVDDQCRTAQPHIFAIGDVSGDPMLAHRASKQGEVVAEVIAGRRAGCDWRTVPAVVFTEPEIATCGLSESEAREAGVDLRIGKFPFAANGRAISTNEAEGFVKLLTDARDGQLLGAVVVGPQASNLISELALAIEMGALAEDLSLTIHPHPTHGEAVMEAAAHSLGHAIHTGNR
jgi:dihydrolipoamide dehydrogenase